MSEALRQIGFIGLGVMGEPICRNLAIKSGLRSGIRIVGHDLNHAPLARLAQHGVVRAASVREAVVESEVVFLCLPSGEAVSELAHAADGLLAHIHTGQMVVDLSTSSVEVTRQLHKDFAARGATFIDAPIARTRAAAEAKKIGEHAGVDPTVLFETLAKGSADSFALRNHGIKAVLKDDFPLRAFSVRYARKDLNYARQLAEDAGIDGASAQKIDALFSQAIDAGDGDRYWPVISRRVGNTGG